MSLSQDVSSITDYNSISKETSGIGHPSSTWDVLIAHGHQQRWRSASKQLVDLFLQFKTSKPNGFPEPIWLTRNDKGVFGSNKHPKMRLGVVECAWYAGRAISCTHLPGTPWNVVFPHPEPSAKSAFTKLSEKHGQSVDEIKHRSITLYLYYIYMIISIYTYSVYLGCWSLLYLGFCLCNGWAQWCPALIATPSASSTPATSWKWPVGMWVCLKMLCTPKPNGFADHYPYEKWLFHWEY